MKHLLFLLLLTTPVYAGSVYIDQVGDDNNILVEQTTNGNGEAILLSKGSNNTMAIIQQGDGNHTAFMGTPPLGKNYDGTYITNSSAPNSDGNNLTILQSGSGNHTAAINLDSTTSNSNDTATITQSGDADKSFTLTLSGSSISATVVQDNPTTADHASMSIQCYTPPCSGYSYTKH